MHDSGTELGPPILWEICYKNFTVWSIRHVVYRKLWVWLQVLGTVASAVMLAFRVRTIFVASRNCRQYPKYFERADVLFKILFESGWRQ